MNLTQSEYGREKPTAGRYYSHMVTHLDTNHAKSCLIFNDPLGTGAIDMMQIKD
jgi:hypothetical protein